MMISSPILLAQILSGAGGSNQTGGGTGPSEEQPVGDIWVNAYGSGTQEVGKRLIQTTSGGFLSIVQVAKPGLGFHTLILKYDEQGRVLKQTRLGWETYSPDIRDIEETSDGGFLVAGSFAGNGYMARFTPNGALAWDRNYKAQSIKEIFPDENGYYYAMGDVPFSAYVARIYGGNGQPHWEKQINSSGTIMKPSGMVPANDGGLILAGTLTENFKRRGFVVKLNAWGNFVWHRAIASNLDVYLEDIAINWAGQFAVTGYLDDPNALNDEDGFVMNLTSNGEEIWNCRLDLVLSDQLHSIGSATGNSWVIGGQVVEKDTNYTYRRAFLAHVDASGEVTWNKLIGNNRGNTYDRFYDVMETRDGGFAGFGSTTSLGDGISALFVKTDPDGLLGCSSAREGKMVVEHEGIFSTPSISLSTSPSNYQYTTADNYPIGYANNATQTICN